jgi:prepilin-type N-terminal cleavage/methylation domain-containing protein
MKLKILAKRAHSVAQLAFTLVEVIVSVALAGIVFVSLYAGMSSGFAVTQVARENLRATQILLERMEGVRLFNWEQLADRNLLPLSFTEYYYPLASNTESKGISYSGRMFIWEPTLNPPATYSANMRAVAAVVNWTNNGVPRQRWIWTYVSRHGVQNYVYYN